MCNKGHYFPLLSTAKFSCVWLLVMGDVHHSVMRRTGLEIPPAHRKLAAIQGQNTMNAGANLRRLQVSLLHSRETWKATGSNVLGTLQDKHFRAKSH